MHLGIDLGTSSVKAILTDGTRLYQDKEKYVGDHNLFSHPVAMVEQAVNRLLQRLVRKTRHQITGLAIGGHGPSIVFIDRKGDPLTSIMTWQDKRASREAGELREKLLGFQRDGTSYEAKILWHYRNHPELFEDGNTVLYPKDYLVHQLTGSRIMDHSTASTIAYHVDESGGWTDWNLGFGTGVFPSVIASTVMAGETGTRYSRSCGLSDGIPVYAGGIDAYCESFGAGAIAHGDVVDGTGTSTCLSVCTEGKNGGDHHVISGRRLAMRTISYSGGSVDWMKEQLGGILELRQQTGVPPGPSGLVFLPYLTGERSPIWDEGARGVFFGLHSDTTKRDMAMAVLEGVAYAVRQNLESFAEPQDQPIRAVGGGAADGHWLQIKADITGRTYWQMEQLDAGALGAAMLSAVGSGQWTETELARSWVRCRQVFHPKAEHRPVYEGLYRIYTGLYPQLKESYRQLQDVYSRNKHCVETGRTSNA